MSIGNRSPTLTDLHRRTGHLMGLQIDREPAVIKAGGRLGLPAHIWHHRPDDIDVIARVTLGEHFGIDITHIHQMLQRRVSPVALTAREALR